MEAKRNLMDLYRRLSRTGEHQAARMILRLLITGSILLGFSDTEWQVERLLEDMGVPVTIKRNGLAVAKIA